MEAIPLALSAVSAIGGSAGVLGTVGTLLSAGFGIVSAINQSNTLAGQAQLAQITAQSGMITAEMEILRGEQEANKIRENLMKTLSSQRARYAGAGIVLDSGTPATVAEDAMATADRETQVVETNAGMKASAARIAALNASARADMLDSQADWTLVSGVAGSVIKGATGLARLGDTLPGSAKLGDKILV